MLKCFLSFRLEDARQWLNGKIFGDVPHPKTGATALHVAAAKGYTKVIITFIQLCLPQPFFDKKQNGNYNIHSLLPLYTF